MVKTIEEDHFNIVKLDEKMYELETSYDMNDNNDSNNGTNNDMSSNNDMSDNNDMSSNNGMNSNDTSINNDMSSNMIESPISYDNSNMNYFNNSNVGTKSTISPISFNNKDFHSNSDNDIEDINYGSFKKNETRSRGSSLSSKSNYDSRDWDSDIRDSELIVRTSNDAYDQINDKYINNNSNYNSTKIELPVKGALQSIFRSKHNKSIKSINVKSNNIERHCRNFTNLSLIEEIGKKNDVNKGAIFTMKFSPDGLYLCTGGHDTNVIIWSVGSHVHGVKVVDDDSSADSKSLDSKGDSSGNNEDGYESSDSYKDEDDNDRNDNIIKDLENTQYYEFICHKPYKKLKGHVGDVTDVSWSGSQFILSASVDKTVRLWHVKKGITLRVFKHKDIVTSVQFHPTNDAYFITGSTDELLSLWNIVDSDMNEKYEPKTSNALGNKISSVCFSNDGNLIAGGSISGKIQLWRYVEDRNGSTIDRNKQFNVRNKRGKHSNGKKVTGLMFIEKKEKVNTNKRRNDAIENLQLLVTTNDNRIRLVDMANNSTKIKFKGNFHNYKNKSMQIKSTLSEDGNYVICGSDGGSVFLWNVSYSAPPTGCMQKKERHNMYESFDPMSGGASTTCAIFAPSTCFNKIFSDNGFDTKQYEIRQSSVCSRIIATADTLGNIKIFIRDLID